MPRSVLESLDSGEEISYTSNPQGSESYKSYWFLGELRQTGHWVVFASWWESRSFIFISQRGVEFSTDELPVFSSDFKSFALSAWGDGEEFPNYFQIWRMGENGPDLQYELVPEVAPDQSPVWGPGKVTWLDPALLRVEKCDANFRLVGTAEFKREGENWSYASD